MKITKDILYSHSDEFNNKLDLYIPDGECTATFVYFHGGGLECGDKADIEFAEGLVQKGIAVVSANYRMYPDAVYPEFIRDAAAAVNWTFEHIEEYGGKRNIFVGGSSAGAYLTMMLCFDKKYFMPYGIGIEDISGFIHDAGQPTTHFNILREKGFDSRCVVVDETAPLYYVEHNTNYPAMLFIVSDNDMPNRLEQTKLMIKTLEHFENDMSKVSLKIMQDSEHDSYLNTEPENGNVFEKIVCDFIINK